MDKFLKIVALFLIISFVASCKQSIRSNVMRFHQLPMPSGEKIMIVPLNSTNNGSIEFANYATLVGNALGNLGYLPANGEAPDLIVELDYGVDDGQKIVRSSPSSFGYLGYAGHYNAYYNPWFSYGNRYSYRGGYSPLFYGGYYGSHYGPLGMGSHYGPFGIVARERDYTRYTRHLKLIIKPNQEGAQNLYEGEAKSIGRNNRLHDVMPYMVEAIFTNFPGESGFSEQIIVDVPENS